MTVLLLFRGSPSIIPKSIVFFDKMGFPKAHCCTCHTLCIAETDVSKPRLNKYIYVKTISYRNLQTGNSHECVICCYLSLG